MAPQGHYARLWAMAMANNSREDVSANAEWILVQEEIYRRISETHSFVRAVFSGRRRNHQPHFDRIDVRPVRIKDELKVQVEFRGSDGVITKNLFSNEFSELALLDSGFSHFLVENRAERLEVRLGKKGQLFRKLSRTNLEPEYEHDKKKKRFLEERDPYLIAVGISDSEGRIKPSMRDKYLQVEEFLKILETSMSAIAESQDPIRIIDLGCGHAYLTFAAFRFFQLKNRSVNFIGVDVKSKTRERNEEIAKGLGIASEISFVNSAIAEYPVLEVDVVIALHACDTATDDALSWAVKANAKVILAAPCCHHNLHQQIKEKPDALIQVFQHGILAVRQVDLLTDALRAAILEVVGFSADVFEFVSGDHTARNLMVRAICVSAESNAERRKAEKLREYRHTCALWGIKPAMEERLELGGIPLSD